MTTAKANIATVMDQVGTGNITAIRTKTDSIDWSDVTGLVTTSGDIKAKTDDIVWDDVTTIKTKTATSPGLTSPVSRRRPIISSGRT